MQIPFILYFYSISVFMPTLTGCNCSKPLLTCSIPYLKFNSFSIKLYGPNLEVNTVKRKYNLVRTLAFYIVKYK